MSDEKVVVAVDAMGGADAPGVVPDGAAQALASDPALELAPAGPARPAGRPGPSRTGADWRRQRG